MKFLKQNYLVLIVLIILLVNVYKLNDLQARYSDLNSQYSMLQSSIQNIANSVNNSTQQEAPEKAAKEVMTPTELAEYMNINLDKVYEIATRDKTMPYVMIDGEYRFNRTAIDKWMETSKTIETR